MDEDDLQDYHDCLIECQYNDNESIEDIIQEAIYFDDIEKIKI